MQLQIFALAALLAGASATVADDVLPALDLELIKTVNSAGASWVAGENDKFIGMTRAEAKKLMGTIRQGPAHVKSMAKLGQWDGQTAPASAIPTSFDVRTAWPQCSSVSGHIADQSSCGSCWAVSSTTSFNDRLCIAKNVTSFMSWADTTACCNFLGGCFGSQGCDGGQPSDAWNYFQATGVVTGGDYGTTTTCYPYPLPPCSHHVVGKYPACPTNEYPTPSCPVQSGSGCTNNGVTWANDLHMASSSYSLNSVQDIQTDLMQRGSITASFEVYEDFLSYRSGVYHYVSGADLGGHAVRVLGWGVWTDGTPYWTIANSWNNGWGDNGIFLIRRGTDECGIEDGMVAGAI